MIETDAGQKEKVAIDASDVVEKEVRTNVTRENWVSEIGKHARRVYSQGMQDGVIEYIFSSIGSRNERYVEFGFGYAKGIPAIRKKLNGTNTWYLKSKGWQGWIFDALIEYEAVGLHKALLTPDNIVETFEKHGVPRDVDYVSIDVDSIDLWLFRALISGGYKPRVVSVEYNANFGYESTVTCDDKWQAWQHDIVYGTSMGALLRVAGDGGYEAVFVDGRLDVFLVRSEVLKESGGQGLSIHTMKRVFPLPQRTHGIKAETKYERFVDYDTFVKTGDMEIARSAAAKDVAAVKQLFSSG